MDDSGHENHDDKIMGDHTRNDVGGTPIPAHPHASPRGWPRLLLLLFAAALLRAGLLITPSVGEELDVALFVRWTQKLCEHGLSGFYKNEQFCDYPPGMLLLFLGTGKGAQWCSEDVLASPWLRSALKVPVLLADLLLGLLLYRAARPLLGPRKAIGAAALWLFNPLGLYDGVFWGQVDAIPAVGVLAALLAVSGGWIAVAGAAFAAALLMKFQAIAFAPLVILEAYRRKGLASLAGLSLGAGLASLAILLPFQHAGTLEECMTRSYVNVVGQYHEITKNAFNFWYLVGPKDGVDTSTPRWLVEAVAGGRPSVHLQDSRLLALNYRRLSLALYALVVAALLTLYARRPGGLNLYLAGGLLGLAFYLFPTEMHERYALPGVVLLAAWAAASSWRERLYGAISVVLLLNLVIVLNPKAIGPHLSALNLIFFAALAARLWRREPAATASVAASAATSTPPSSPSPAAASAPPAPSAPRRRLIPLFQRLTIAAWALAIAAAGGAAWLVSQTRLLPTPDGQIWLSELSPRAVKQGWGELRKDAAATGGPIRIADTFYLRGLGTHGPSRLVYDIPEGYEWFLAEVGVDHAAGGKGSIIAAVDLDGRKAYESPVLTGGGSATEVRVNVAGAQRMILRIESTEDGQRGDHANWALARFSRAPAEPRP